jgi:hypothetical protein
VNASLLFKNISIPRPHYNRKSDCIVVLVASKNTFANIIGMDIRLKFGKPPPSATDIQLIEKQKEDDHQKQQKLY